MINKLYIRTYNILKHTPLFGRGQLIKYLEQELVPECNTLLDLGCGSESPIAKFSQRLSYSVGIDIFEESISLSKSAKIHSEYKKMDVLDIENEFDNKSFDCVTAFELIEHLTKEDGLKLLKMMEKKEKKKIVISTPNGFVEQHEYDDNPYQVHLSGYSYEEMKKMGFRIIGVGGWKGLRGERGNIVCQPKIFWFLISRLTQFYVKNHPENAFTLLCVKYSGSQKWDNVLR